MNADPVSLFLVIAVAIAFLYITFRYGVAGIKGNKTSAKTIEKAGGIGKEDERHMRRDYWKELRAKDNSIENLREKANVVSIVLSDFLTKRIDCFIQAVIDLCKDEESFSKEALEDCRGYVLLESLTLYYWFIDRVASQSLSKEKHELFTKTLIRIQIRALSKDMVDERGRIYLKEFFPLEIKERIKEYDGYMGTEEAQDLKNSIPFQFSKRILKVIEHEENPFIGVYVVEHIFNGMRDLQLDKLFGNK